MDIELGVSFSKRQEASHERNHGCQWCCSSFHWQMCAFYMDYKACMAQLTKLIKTTPLKPYVDRMILLYIAPRCASVGVIDVFDEAVLI